MSLSRVIRAAAVIALLPAIGSWMPGARAQQRPPSDELEILPVRPNLFMITGAGANIAVSVGREGLIVVDTASAAMADRVLAAIDRIAERHKTTVQGADIRPRIRYIFNTSAHPDHVGGNEKLSKAGLTLAGGAVPARRSADDHHHR